MTRRRVAPVLALLLLLAGCSLPLPRDVRAPSGVSGQQLPADLQVLPEGPQPGQGPAATVAGFLAAQTSPTGDYAIAREFLTDRAASQWSPDRGVRVFQPDTEQVEQTRTPGVSPQIAVSMTLIGTVDQAGHYVAGTQRTLDFYGVIKTSEGWRVSTVPPDVGLHLSQIDLRRTYAARNVFYVAKPVGPADPPHLVPDRVFLPATGDVDSALVQRLFAPPSDVLTGSVVPGDPALRLASVARSRDGVVTVTLAGHPDSLPATDLRDLSARLVWTLRSDPLFRGLRLAGPDGVLHLEGTPEVQARTAWEAYDPEGLDPSPSYYFVVGHRVRSSGGALPPSPLTRGTLPVDVVAVNPRDDRLAALHSRGREVEVYLGSTRGSTVSRAVEAVGLSSPTWGSGEGGLWMLQGSEGIVRLDAAAGRLRPVAAPGRPAGPLRSLALSRDGARAALVIGGSVYVGNVVWSLGEASVQGLVPVPTSGGAGLQAVWASPTELVVLELAGQGGARGVQRVAVDGSVTGSVPLGLLTPTSVAAAGPVLVLASGHALWRVTQGINRVQSAASAPAFPG